MDAMPLHIGVVSIFPEMVTGAARYGVTGRALDRGLVALRAWNPRDFTGDRHRTVDDRPYGGGPGMVMMYEPLAAAIRAARRVAGRAARVIHLSPQGRRFDQNAARELAAGAALVLVCGRYEGIDERLVDAEIDAEISVGDYVLSGGEPAALVIIDAIARLLPGALGDADSAAQDSFADDLLDCPHYTRPEAVEGREVPAVLRTGDHEATRRWRLKQSLGQTWLRRPDLMCTARLDDERRALLEEFVAQHAPGRRAGVAG